MYGIYCITNKINNKKYIGKSQNIEGRWQYHQTRYMDSKEYNKSLYQAFRKYGLENFQFDVIEEMTEEIYNRFANNREEYWIIFYDTVVSGYNETRGGDGGYNEKSVLSNRKLSVDEVKEIRQLYNDCQYCFQDAYELYAEKISRRGFQAVWLGQNYKQICPEVFTEENKRKHILLEHQRQGKLRREKKQ